MSEVTRYDLNEDVATGALFISRVPESMEGRYVAYEDYAELKAQRDELEDKLARSQDWSIGVDSERMEYVEKCNALAAENGALKLVLEPKQIPDEIQDLFNDTVKLDGDSDGYHEWSWVDNPDEVIIAVMNAMPKPETPATDAYLNSVRAEGVDMFISELAELFKTLKTGGKPWQAIKGVVLRAASFSAKLRAGEPS